MKRNHINRMWKALLPLILMLINATWAAAIDDSIMSIPSPVRISKDPQPVTGTYLTLDPHAFMALKEASTVIFENFPLKSDESIDIRLDRFSITTPITVIHEGTENGNILHPNHEMVLFRGSVLDRSDSRIIVGISPRNFYALIHLEYGGYAVSKVSTANENNEDGLYQIQKLSEIPGPRAENRINDLLEEPIDLPVTPTTLDNLPLNPRLCRLALECDYELYARNGYSIGSTLDYIYFVFAAVGIVFERDISTKLALTYIRIWTTINDPYTDNHPGCDGLGEFRDYWNAYHNPGQPDFIERDLAHLMAGRSGLTSCAAMGVLCDYNYGFSISSDNAGGGGFAHDFYHIAHEIGHNFDGLHTHCFNPPLDQCYALDPGCNSVQDCSTAPGTIMSYCSDCPGIWDDMLPEFHSANISRMITHVNQSCLQYTLSPCYVDWRNTGSEDGTLAHPFNTVIEGTHMVAPGGTVRIANGSYAENETIWQPMILEATGGAVTIGP